MRRTNRQIKRAFPYVAVCYSPTTDRRAEHPVKIRRFDVPGAADAYAERMSSVAWVACVRTFVDGRYDSFYGNPAHFAR